MERLEVEPRRDCAKRGARAARRPEQVRIGLTIDRQALAGRGHDLDRTHAVARQASPRLSIPPHAATQQVTADRHACAVRERKCEALGLESLAEFRRADAGLGADQCGVRVDLDLA
jgi:hypothetical protein